MKRSYDHGFVLCPHNQTRLRPSVLTFREVAESRRGIFSLVSQTIAGTSDVIPSLANACASLKPETKTKELPTLVLGHKLSAR